ncbi:MAG: hypothetical protein CBC29_06975 [Methylococcaceae bacterium TMED69]|nr:MAG: hypothetical protein CBC29_06975 [Methylococcaceae bacterium TMED69]|tara:strand:+ start:1520 stop:2071 length:552 start_codon:yes stop_codon:yes gene_type:complete
MEVILQIILAFLYSHLLEYILHRYLLHNPKRKKWFKTHFAEHHKVSRKYMMIDPKYLEPKSLRGDPEIKGLLLLGVIHLPVVLIYPYAYAALIICSLEYYWIHRKAHSDLSWARNYCPWHYDHHLAPNQNANWGVRRPWFDYVFGTRKKYKGQKKEIIKHVIIKNKILSITQKRKNENRPYRD